jgi:regulator of nucleoside diphosphate kinase
MKQHNIFVTEEDMERLRQLLVPAEKPPSRDQEHLEMLAEELDRARVVSPSQVPEDAVTMNSKVRVKDLDTGNDATYTLVFPPDADIARGKTSVLAPIGTAILGYRVGDVIKWRVPGGRRRLRVEEVLYQPEAADAASVQNRRLREKATPVAAIGSSGRQGITSTLHLAGCNRDGSKHSVLMKRRMLWIND